MSLQDKFDAVSSLIEDHNVAIGGSDEPGYIDPEAFISCIKVSGGTKEDRLRDFSYEDILQCLPAVSAGPTGEKIKPKLLAKEIAKIFRGKEEANGSENQEEKKIVISNKKAGKMTVTQLVAAFDPEFPDNAVAKELKKLAGDMPFIVYSSGRTVDVATTCKLLKELKDYGPRDFIEVNGDPKPTHRIGELPDNCVPENPLYPGRPLRPDGTCDQLNRSWEGIPDDVRQFVRLMLENKLIEPSGRNGREAAMDLMDLALLPDAMKKLKQRYPKIAIEFDKFKKLGKLPVLSIVLGKPLPVGGAEVSGPFDNGQRVMWVQPMPPAKKFYSEPWPNNNYYGTSNNYYGAAWVYKPDNTRWNM